MEPPLPTDVNTLSSIPPPRQASKYHNSAPHTRRPVYAQMARYRVIKGDGGFFVTNRRTGKIYGWYPKSKEKAEAHAASMETWFSHQKRPANRWTKYLCRKCSVKVAEDAEDEKGEKRHKRHKFHTRA